AGATARLGEMLLTSVVVLFASNGLEAWTRRRGRSSTNCHEQHTPPPKPRRQYFAKHTRPFSTGRARVGSPCTQRIRPFLPGPVSSYAAGCGVCRSLAQRLVGVRGSRYRTRCPVGNQAHLTYCRHRRST